MVEILSIINKRQEEEPHDDNLYQKSSLIVATYTPTKDDLLILNENNKELNSQYQRKQNESTRSGTN